MVYYVLEDVQQEKFEEQRYREKPPTTHGTMRETNIEHTRLSLARRQNIKYFFLHFFTFIKNVKKKILCFHVWPRKDVCVQYFYIITHRKNTPPSPHDALPPIG